MAKTTPDVTGASLEPIYQRLNSAPQYHPLEADTFGDWSMEAGDVVTISRDGRSYDSPVHNSTVSWKKGQKITVSSGGNQKRESVTKMSQKKFSRGGSGLRNSQYQHWYAGNLYDQMRSGLEMTASSAHLFTMLKYGEMQSGLKLTGSTAHLYTQLMYGQMRSGLYLTGSTAHLYTDLLYGQMKSGLYLTGSTAHLYTSLMYGQMKSGLYLTGSTAHLYTSLMYGQMKSGLYLTGSTAKLYTDLLYGQMRAGLYLTGSTAHVYTSLMYGEMRSGLYLTGSTARLYAEGLYGQLKSGLTLTSSYAYLYVSGLYEQMKSGLYLTASTADLYVKSVYEQMKSGLKLTSSAAQMYVEDKTKKASLILAITDGKSSAKLTADVIELDGKTIASRMYGEDVTVHDLTVQGDATFQDGITASSIDVADGTIACETLMVNLNEVEIYDASVSGNTLTIYKTDGTTITFSKAASVSGEWSGTTYQITANGSRVPAADTSVHMGVDGSGDTVYVKVYHDNPSDPTNQLDLRQLTMSEKASNKQVVLNLILDGTTIQKATISTSATYNAGWDYGLTQRTMWGRAATSSEQAIKNLSYGEKWTVGFTFTKANGTTEDSKYTLQAPAQQTIAVQGVWLDTQYSGVVWNAYAHTSDGVDHGPVFCDCTSPYNQGVTDAYASLSDAGISRSADYEEYSQKTLSTIKSNGNYFYRIRVKDAGGNVRFIYYYTLPVSVADSNPEKHHHSVTMKCSDAVAEGGNVTYTMTFSGTSYNFAKGSSYTFAYT